MDIITDFGSVVPGSSPGGCTRAKQQQQFLGIAAVVLETERLLSRLVCKAERYILSLRKECREPGQEILSECNELRNLRHPSALVDFERSEQNILSAS